MDEDGFAALSSVENLSRRANIPLEETEQAVKILESPDKFNNKDEFEGRRIERVENGWIILKAPHYRSILSREVAREQTRIRVANWREKQKGVTNQTLPNVTSVTVTQQSRAKHTKADQNKDNGFDSFWSAYPKKQSKPDAERAWTKLKDSEHPKVLAGLERWKGSNDWKRDNGQFIPFPATFLNKRRWEDSPARGGSESKVEEQMRKMYDEAGTR